MAGEHTGASGSGAASSGPRAIEAASAAAISFVPRTSAMALRVGDRHMDRFAPEQDALARSRSLRALAFSDRVLGSHMSMAQQRTFRLFGPEQEPGGAREHDVESINWIFPRPWYLDEMSWLGAARSAAEQSARRHAVASGEAGARGMIPLGLVAPSFSPEAVLPRAPQSGATHTLMMRPAGGLPATSLPTGRAMSASQGQPGGRTWSAGPSAGQASTVADTAAARPPRSAVLLRAWNPLTPFAAAQAAELMTGVMRARSGTGRQSAGDDASRGALEPLAMLELVAPAELASRGAAPAATPTATPRSEDASSGAAVPEALRNRLERVLRQAESRQRQSSQAQSSQTGSVDAAVHAAPGHEHALAPPARTHGAVASTPEPGAARAGERPSVSPVAGPVPAPERAADLLARALLSGHASFAPVAGARVVLPAGVGGLVAGMRAADVVHKPISAVSSRSAIQRSAGQSMRSMSSDAHALQASAPAPGGASDTRSPAQLQASSARLPALEWADGATGDRVAAPRRAGSAYRAIAASRPSALDHIAWADRWLARFAGASPESLATLDATTGEAGARRSSRLLSSMAPLRIFLEPPAVLAGSGREATGTAPGLNAPPMTAALPPAPRMNDDDVVPDEVFAAIAAAPLRRPGAASRGTSMGKPASATPAESGDAGERRARGGRPAVDQLVRQDPGVPGPGVRVALASSPVAPALTPVMPLPPAQRFDVRAVSGGDLARVYLAGLMTPLASVPASPADVRGMAERAPWAELVSAPARVPRDVPADPLDPAAASTSPAAQADGWQGHGPGDAPVHGQGLGRHGARMHTGTGAPVVDRGMAAALPPSTGADARAGAAAAYANTYSSEPGSLAARAESWAVEQERSSADLAFDFVPPELILAARSYGFGPSEAAQAVRLAVAGQSGLVTLATAVDLAFLEVFAGQAAPRSSGDAAGVGQGSTQAAGQGIAPAVGPDAGPAVASGDITLPSNTNRTDRHPAFGLQARAPRGAFLWPQATALAMNLQPAGAASADHASSLAALDLLAAHAVAEIATFVAPAGASAAAPARTLASARDSAAALEHRQDGVRGDQASTGPSVRTAHTEAGPAFEYTPLAPDSIAAYLPRTSLLAASAPLATYVTPIIEDAYQDFDADSGAGGVMHREAGLPAMGRHAQAGSGSMPGRVPGHVFDEQPLATSSHASAEGREDAAAFSRIAAKVSPEIEAIYVALSQSPDGRSMSPAVRAARALAMAEAAGVRGSSARARAAAAWAMMPMVLVGSGRDQGTMAAGALGSEPLVPALSMQPGGAMPDGRQEHAEMRHAAARAGESLQSLIAPYDAQAALVGDARATRRSGAAGASAHQVQQGAVLRAPTAAQPLVQTGASQPRSSSAAAREMIRAAQMKRATGSPDIPPWFEEAARRMFEDKAGDGISLAEMTLVTAAPARHVAASPKTASASSQPPQAQGGSETGANEPTADVEQLAREVYAEICRFIEVARERNGDTWR